MSTQDIEKAVQAILHSQEAVLTCPACHNPISEGQSLIISKGVKFHRQCLWDSFVRMRGEVLSFIKNLRGSTNPTKVQFGYYLEKNIVFDEENMSAMYIGKEKWYVTGTPGD